MIVTVQGYNGKKSKSAQTACIIAGMLALRENSNTLLLQCINNDINSIENIFYGKDSSKQFGTNETDFADSGIDALLRSVGSTRVGAEDFEKYCTSLTTIKNRLDITECSKTNIFEQTVLTMGEELENILTGAKNVYDNVIILGPCDEPDTTEMLNKYADLSIYCITQGHKAAGKAYGKNIYYLVTDFEDTSSINLSVIKKEYHTGGVFTKNNVLKLSRNVAVRDAAITGSLLRYIRDNRECSEYEAHYEWYKDVQKILALINQTGEEERSYNWEVQEYGTYEYGLLDVKVKEAIAARQTPAIVVPSAKKGGFFFRLFGLGKPKAPVEKKYDAAIDSDTVQGEVESFEFEETEPVSDQKENVTKSDMIADGIIDDIAQEINPDESGEDELTLDPASKPKSVEIIKKTPVKKATAKKTTSTKPASRKSSAIKKTADEPVLVEDKNDTTKKTVTKKAAAAKKPATKAEATTKTTTAKASAKKTSSAKVATKTAAKKTEGEKIETDAKIKAAEKPKRVVKAAAPKKKVSPKAVAEEAV